MKITLKKLNLIRYRILMKTTIQLEEAAKFILTYLLSLYLGYDWWVFLAWLLAPDISIAAYAINKKIGAITYNIFHHQGIAIVVGLAGLYFNNTDLQLAGLILFGHSAMDRMFGYGLKHFDDFKHTHLGWIGKTETKN